MSQSQAVTDALKQFVSLTQKTVKGPGHDLCEQEAEQSLARALTAFVDARVEKAFKGAQSEGFR